MHVALTDNPTQDGAKYYHEVIREIGLQKVPQDGIMGALEKWGITIGELLAALTIREATEKGEILSAVKAVEKLARKFSLSEIAEALYENRVAAVLSSVSNRTRLTMQGDMWPGRYKID